MTTCSSRAATFSSKKGSGSHNIVVRLRHVQRQARVRTTTSRAAATASSARRRSSAARTVYPQLLTTGANRTLLQYDPIRLSSLGTNFRTHSLFVNDNLRVERQADVQPRAALRQEPRRRRDGQPRGAGQRVEPAPRRVWDPKGDGNWAVTTSFAKYVAAIANSIADSSSSAAGSPSSFQWAYNGAADQPRSERRGDTRRHGDRDSAGVQRVQARFRGHVHDHGRDHRVLGARASASGFRNALDFAQRARIRGRRQPPARQRGGRPRRLRRSATTTTSTLSGSTRRPVSAVDSFGNPTDIAIVENTNDLKRRYQRPHPLGHVPHQRPDRRRRQLHAVAALGQFRRRERHQRTCAGDTVPVSGISPRRRGTRLKATCRPISAIGRVCGSTTACRRSTA